MASYLIIDDNTTNTKACCVIYNVGQQPCITPATNASGTTLGGVATMGYCLSR